MIFAWLLPDVIVNALVSAVFGSLFAAVAVAFLTQRWIERREQRNRLYAMKLDLYVDALDLVLDNERALAETDTDGKIPPIELQRKQIHIHHRLRLLAPHAVTEAYDTYSMLVFQSTAHPIRERPKDPGEVVRARDRLVDMMADDINVGRSRSGSSRDAPSAQPRQH